MQPAADIHYAVERRCNLPGNQDHGSYRDRKNYNNDDNHGADGALCTLQRLFHPCTRHLKRLLLQLSYFTANPYGYRHCFALVGFNRFLFCRFNQSQLHHMIGSSRKLYPIVLDNI